MPPPGAASGLEPMPSLAEVMEAVLPVLRRVPIIARQSAAAALSKALRHVADPDGWTRVFMWPKVVLAPVPRTRGPPGSTVRYRAKRFMAGHFVNVPAMWAETRAQFAAALPPHPTPTPVHPGITDDPQPATGPRLLDGPLDSEVSPAQAMKALREVREFRFSRANSALAAAPLADTGSPAVIAALQAMHPDVPPPTVPVSDLGPLEETVFPRSRVSEVLRQFALGSAGGPSRLSAQHLVDLTRFVGSPILDALVPVLGRIAAGRVPAEVRPYLFGARLVALSKVGGGVRPVAVGETLRRVAAKLLMSEVGKEAASLLIRDGQVGVAVESGADAMIHAVRRFIDAGLDANEVVVKVDFANAFNSVDRSLMLAELCDVFPALLGYAVAAYAAPSLLFLKSTTLLSKAGVQQGDPLGPLLFALTLRRALRPIPRDRLSLHAWYLDDGVVAGDADAVSDFLGHLDVFASHAGLALNYGKCEVTGPGHLHEALESRMTRTELSRTILLGAPVGSQEGARAFVAQVAVKAEARCKLVRALAEFPAEASALLRYCCGVSVGTYYARAVGTTAREALLAIDNASVVAFKDINFPGGADEEAMHPALFKLPTRFGGMGLGSLYETCSLAFFASNRQAAQFFLALCPASPRTVLAPDTWGVSLESDLFLRSSPAALLEVLRQRDLVKVPKRSLSLLCAAYWSDAVQVVRTTLPPRLVAMTLSAGAKHANAWVAPPPGAEGIDFLSPAEHTVLIRRRFGLPVCGPSICANCNRETLDVLGDHALSCIHGPNKWTTHNALRDVICRLTGAALWRPAREPACFPDDLSRPDVGVWITGAGRPRWVLIDVAVISETAATNLRAALSAPGGAATAYERTKFATYQVKATSVGATLVPLIMDSNGAWGNSALPFFSTLARALAIRSESSVARTSTLMMASIANFAMRGVARSILRASASLTPV